MAFRSDPLGPAPGPSSALTTRNVAGVIRPSSTSNAALRALDLAQGRETARPRSWASGDPCEAPRLTNTVILEIMPRPSASKGGIRGRPDGTTRPRLLPSLNIEHP